jgi:hypothetical protein
VTPNSVPLSLAGLVAFGPSTCRASFRRAQ